MEGMNGRKRKYLLKNLKLGTEILKGRFTESDPETGKWIADHNEFEIDLSDFPTPQLTLFCPMIRIKSF